jgi:hypothetical protein
MDHTELNPAFAAFVQELKDRQGGNRGQAQGKTLFAKITAVLKAARDDTPQSHREMLTAILELKSGRGQTFQGVPVDKLQDLVSILFMDKTDLLPDRIFKDFKQKDLVGYIEICRRYFLTMLSGSAALRVPPQYGARPTQPAKETANARPTRPAKEAANARPTQPAKAPASEPIWMRNPDMGIPLALRVGDRECAAYVLKNAKQYSKHLSLAKRVLGEESIIHNS